MLETIKNQHSKTKNPSQFVVIGGGISGLAAAYRLTTDGVDHDLQVRLLEAGDRVGGVIGTRREDGFIMEEGPDCFISSKPWALDLCRELGIEDDLEGTNTEMRKSFIVRGKRLLPIPEGFYLLAPTSFSALLKTPVFSWPGKLRMAMELLIPRKREASDESLEQFVVRRLGREAFERMAQPMVAGIYTADPKKLSIQATFPQFLEWEQEYGSVIRALLKQGKESTDLSESSGPRYSLFLSFKDGLHTLVEALVRKLPNETIRPTATVTGLSRADGGWRIELSGGDSLDADAVCIALPSMKTAELLADSMPELARALKEIPYLGTISVNLIFDRKQIAHPLDGMGFVVPAVEGRALLACTFSSIKFSGRAPEGKVLLRAFLGGPERQNLLEQTDEEIGEIVMNDLAELLDISGSPDRFHVHRHPASMAQYHLGHLDRIARIESLLGEVPNLAIAGNAYHGVGIPDCIHSAQKASAKLLQFHQRPDSP